MTGDSQVHNLSLADSHIHLNNASDAQSANQYHTLKINHLSGNGHFHYLTHLAENLGDKVLVKESASGHYQLHVQDKTGEPNQEGLNLFDASSVQDRSRLSVSLANNHVDLGALRYTIKTENGITRLYNPYAENRRRVKPVPSPATNTASQAQTDSAQIAKPQNIVVAPPSPQANQAEEAKRQQAKAEQVKRQQAEAEKVAHQKAEEAKRQQDALARQQAEQERQRLEAERQAAEIAKQKAEAEEAKRRAAEIAEQKAAAEEAKRQAAELARQQEEARKAAELAAKQKAETERKAAEIAEQKAEAEREAAELAKQKAEEEEGRQAAQSQPKRRNRRAIPPELSSDATTRALPRIARNSNPDDSDYEEIPLDELEDEEVLKAASTSNNQPQNHEESNKDIEAVGLQPRSAQPQPGVAATQADAVSTNTNSALSDAMASTQSILLDTGASLTRHIAQKSRADAEKNSVWMSNTGYGRDYASAQYRRFSSKRTQTQIGIDRSLSENMQIGGVLTYSDSQHTFDQASGKNTFVQANLYGKYYLNDAWYVAGDIGAGSLRSRLQTQQKANFNRTSIQTGLTLGNTLKINQFEIVPSAGIRYSRLSSADYKLGDDSVKVSSMSVKTLTAGLDFAYRFKVGNLTVKPLLSAAYFANYGKGGVNVGSNSFVYKADNQQQYSAGAALLYRNVTLNVNGSITKGKQLEKQKSGQIKIQIRF